MVRMMKVHNQLLSGRFPNCRKLAESLEVSQKTIQRDIEFMRSQLGLPIEYNQLEFGFYYTEPVVSFPCMEVTEGEMVALFVAEKAMEQYRGTSFEKPLRGAFRKISEALRDKIAFQWDESAISFRAIGATASDIESFEAISSAVLKSHEVEFEYRKLGSSRYELRRVQPYHLSCIDQQWYLFAFDLARQQLRTFVLSRMRKVRSRSGRFKRPPNFSINSHLGDSLQVFTGKGRHQVRVEFDAFAARLVSERQWHGSQKLKALRDGRVALSLQLASLEEIERWILSWGAHARVIAPPELVRRIRTAAESIVRQA